MNHAAFIRSIRGAPLTVLVTLLLDRELRMGTQEIVTATGYSKKTVIEALNTLQALNLAQSHARYHGWQITAHVQQLILPAPGDPGTGMPAEVEILHLPSGSSRDDRVTKDLVEPDPRTTTTTAGEVEILHLPEPWEDLVALLIERCTTPPAAARQAIGHAHEAGFYPSYVRYQILRWLAYCLSERGQSIRHVGAYIARRIGQEIPCPDWFNTPDGELGREIRRARAAWDSEQEQEDPPAG